MSMIVPGKAEAVTFVLQIRKWGKETRRIPRGKKEVWRREKEQDLGVNPSVLAWKSQFGEVHSIIRA